MKFIFLALALIASVYGDVSELPSSDYLPPAAEPVSAPAPPPAPAPSPEYLPPAAPEVGPGPETVVDDDGYRYKTHRQRKIRYRRRRF